MIVTLKQCTVELYKHMCINISVSYHISTTMSLFSLYGVHQYFSFIPHFYHSVDVLIIWCASISQFHTTFLPLCYCSHYMVCINISVSYHIYTTLSLFSLYGVHQYFSFIPHFYHSVVVLIIWCTSISQFQCIFHSNTSSPTTINTETYLHDNNPKHINRQHTSNYTDPEDLFNWYETVNTNRFRKK